LLAVAAWYHSYLALLLCIPAFLICARLLPAKNTETLSPANEKLRLPGKVYYYPVITMLFMFIYNIFMVNISVFISENAFGDASFAGIVNALFMLASVGSGLLFGNLSARIGEYTIALAFILLAAGYLIVCYSGSVAGLIAGALISGFSLSLNMSQCVYSVSKRTPPILAAMAMSLTITVLPNIGMFASPTVFAALSRALSLEGSGGKFLLGAIASIVIAAVTGIITARTKKEGTEDGEIKIKSIPNK
jgi:MFS family permease